MAVDINTEYLESDRFPEDVAELALRDYIRRKYQQRPIDVVLAIAEPALEFALRFRRELFPGAPVVYSGITERTGSIRSDDGGVTGVVTGPSYGASAELALRMHPTTDQLVVVAHAPTYNLERNVRSALHDIDKRVKVSYISEPAIARVLAAIKTVPEGNVILFVRHSQEEAGNILNPADVAALVATAARVPVYGVSDSYVGSGIVGGVVTEAREVGREVGLIARQILDGSRPQDIPIRQLPLTTVFDWRQLRRWRIAERSLPAGSAVRFRTPSTWELHKEAIIGVTAVVALQSLLIAALVLERRRRRRAELESRRNLAAMAHLDRRAAMGQLATSLAHELNQPLNAILQNAGVAQMLIASNPLPPPLSEMTDIIGDIRKDDIRASEVIRRMRGLLQKHELESQPVDVNEVAQDTVAIVQPDARSRNIDLDVALADDIQPILGDRVHLQQVLLNLLMNALDAVAAMPPDRRRVRVWTTQSNGEVRMAVADTGVSIPADRVSDIFEPFYTTKAGSGMGMGLAIARNIVDAHAGHMAAENNPGGGATVWFSVPVSR
jgi:signal transduction histidine kinase